MCLTSYQSDPGIDIDASMCRINNAIELTIQQIDGASQKHFEWDLKQVWVMFSSGPTCGGYS